jgi:hypothetical protein
MIPGIRPLLLPIAAWLCGCAATTPPVAALAPAALANATYRTEFAAGGTATLREGTYRERVVPNSATTTIIGLGEQRAAGDLNGDGAPDAAVILVSDPGGSGTFYELAVVVNEEGRPRHAASVLLGDRVNVLSLAIRSQIVTVDLLYHETGDPLFCPRRSYRLEGDKLVSFWGMVP